MPRNCRQQRNKANSAHAPPFCLPQHNSHTQAETFTTYVHGGFSKKHYLLTILKTVHAPRRDVHTMWGPICSKEKLFLLTSGLDGPCEMQTAFLLFSGLLLVCMISKNNSKRARQIGSACLWSTQSTQTNMYGLGKCSKWFMCISLCICT